MLDKDFLQYSIDIDLSGKPWTHEEVAQKSKFLRAAYRQNLNFVLATIALAGGVTFRALSLGFDSEGELVKLGLSIGAWFGLFCGIMIDGTAGRKLQMILVGVIVSSAAGLFCSLLLVLMLDQTTAWITGVNILASALGCFWLLTYYDEVLKGLEHLKTVDRRQLFYIDKAAGHFEELHLFVQQMQAMGRMPMLAEYWAFREWVAQKANSTN